MAIKQFLCSNFADSTSEAELFEFFQRHISFGEVTEMRILRKRDGQRKAYLALDLVALVDIDLVLDLDGYLFGDEPLRVQELD